MSTHELGAFTTYAKRVYYETNDATAAMTRGTGGNEHVIGVSVGDGWYAQSSVDVGQNTLLLQASILYTDGTRASTSFWDHVSRCSQPCAIPPALCGVLYLVAMRMGC